MKEKYIELYPHELKVDQIYYLKCQPLEMDCEKVRLARIQGHIDDGNAIHYFVDEKGNTILDSGGNGLFQSSNGAFWHVFKLDKQYNYSTVSNKLFAKEQ